MEMTDRYDDLYETMTTSGDVEKMRIFGKAERWAFRKMAESHPSFAGEWLNRLEAVDWNNYLTEDEARGIVSDLVNQDGRKGGMWSVEQVQAALNGFGGKMNCPPYYNGFALYAVMNMLASDHLSSVSEFVSEGDIPKFIYALSVDKLRDADRPEFVRSYFRV